MRVPWFAAFTVAFVNFNAINGVRDEASNTLSEGNTVSVVEQVTHDGVETVGVENQDSVARTSDPNVGVTDDYANAVWWAYPHARPNTKLEIPNAWVLEFVNPKWKYNKQDWKSYKLNWKKQITNADTWRKEIKKDLETDHSKWNDKIWLNNWFREKKTERPRSCLEQIFKQFMAFTAAASMGRSEIWHRGTHGSTTNVYQAPVDRH